MVGENFSAQGAPTENVSSSATSFNAPTLDQSVAAPVLIAAPSSAMSSAALVLEPTPLNPTPTCIVLDEPYAVGDLAPGVTYPHVYITTLYLNGPALSMTVQYEVGTMRAVWQRAPQVATFSLHLGGVQLVPFFTSKISDTGSPYLWDQVELLIYGQVKQFNPRFTGVVEAIDTSAEATP